jgi:hypothetical protein
VTRIPLARLGLAALLAAVLLAVAGAPAWAHGDKAYTLVREAIALMVNKPSAHDAILDKINDALQAKDKSNVDMPLVAQAKDAFLAGDGHKAQALLEQSIGAQVHTSTAEPMPINTPPPSPGASSEPMPPMAEASASPAAAMADLPGRGSLGGGDWVLIVVSLLVGVGGILLAARLRPHLSRHLAARPADGTETAR